MTEPQDPAAPFDVRENPDWTCVGAFPADFRSIQPLGARLLSPYFGQNESYLKYEKLIEFLLEKNIPFHTQTAETSTFNAQEVFVPKEFESAVRAALQTDPA